MGAHHAVDNTDAEKKGKGALSVSAVDVRPLINKEDYN